MFGLDNAGGVNRSLERTESAAPALPKDKTQMLVEPTDPSWLNDTASFSHDGKNLTVARTDYNEAPSRFGITVAVNGVARTLCPQMAGRQYVPHGPAEGTRYYSAHAKTPVRPGDRVTITDEQRNKTATVIIG